MAAQQLAPRAVTRPLREYSIHLRSATEYREFIALATSSTEALCNAIATPDLVPPVGASAFPIRSSSLQ